MSTEGISVGEVSKAVSISLIGGLALWNFDVAARVYLLWSREHLPDAFDKCIIDGIRGAWPLSRDRVWKSVEQFVDVTAIERTRINAKLAAQTLIEPKGLLSR